MRTMRVLLTAVMLCSFLLTGTKSNAADVSGIEISASSRFIRKGEETDLTFSLKGYSGIEDGINVLKGALEYDTDVFEAVSQENFETANSWEKLFYNPRNGQFVLINKGGSMREESVFSVRLVARQSIPAKETSVTVRDLSVSEGREDIDLSDVSFSLSAVSELPWQSTEGEDGNLEDKGNDSVQTGDSLAGIFPVAGVFLGSAVLIGVVLFRKRMGKFSGKKKILMGVIVCTGVVLLSAGGIYAFAGKGDLDNDGDTDYTDVELLEKHLIGLKLLPDKGRRGADMNADGTLTVTDLSLLIRKIEKSVDYEVKLSSAMERFHYEKKEEIQLRFQADVSYGTLIEKVTVNGEEYEAEREEGSAVYHINVETGDNSGVKEFHITEVWLEGGQKVKTDYTEKIDVLKEEPAAEAFLAEELTDTAQMKISFDLKDADLALTHAEMKVIKDLDGTLIVSKKLKAGHHQFVLDLEEDTVYKVHIAGYYDRATGKLPSEDSYRGSFTAEKEIQLNLEYSFTFSSLKAALEDGTLTDRFSRNQPVTLTFESGNATRFMPESAVVNGKVYPVVQKDQGYTVTLGGFDKIGNTQIRVEQIILENGKSFRISDNNEINIMILKETPKVYDFSVKEDAENNQFEVAFRLTDPDGTLSGHKVRIQNVKGDVVGEQEFRKIHLDNELFEEAITLSDRSLTTEYTVQITADCDLTEDGTEQEEGKILAEKTVKAEPRVQIADGRASTLYAEKGENTELFYGVEHNIESGITAFVVDNLEVHPKQQQDGTWKVSVPAPLQAGVHAFALSQVVFRDGMEVSAKYETQVEVLKDIPAVENVVCSKTAENELHVQLELLDPDHALQDARVQIKEEGGKILLNESVTGSESTVSTALTAMESYIITVTADYDRDTNTIENQSNEYKNEILYTEKVYASRDALEFKDITAEKLYYHGINGREEVRVLDITEGLPKDTDRYFAMIEMENMPDFYAGIREFRKEKDSEKVYAVLDQEEVVRYEADGSRVNGYAFPIAYKDDEGEHPVIASAEELFDAMEANPKGNFRLTEDLDASAISADQAAIAGRFTGELDGNGYRIRNLKTSLFSDLSGAYIHDLVIEDAAVTVQRKGILSEVIQNKSKIENVFLVDSSISNGVDGMGAFAGRLANSEIRRSASINVSVKGLVAIGGIVGKTETGAVIEDCYVTGKIQGTYDHPSLGARTGGIAGWHGGGKISRCYTKAKIVAPAKKGNGGIIGGPNTGTPSIEYSLSMSNGDGYRIAGFDVLGNAKEVYEHFGSGSTTNITEDNAGNVKETDAVYDKSFYKNTLGYDDRVWEFRWLSFGKTPSLKKAPVMENNLGIPNYSIVTKHKDYLPEKETAYANMAKMMPFSDSRLWVAYGNRIPEGSKLGSERIRFILPIHEKGSLISGLRKSEPDDIEKIRIVYETGKMEEHHVAYRKLTGELAALYDVEGTDLKYEFGNYISDIDGTVLSDTVNMVKTYDYVGDIAVLTPEEESRLYADYYNENVKGNMETILQKLFSAGERYPTYSSHPAVQTLAEERMRDNKELKRILYAYNYYDKWYRIGYKGVTLSDLMFFSGELMADGMTYDALTEQLLSAASGQRNTDQTVTFYNNVLKNYTGQDLTGFLGDLSESLAGYEDPNEWFRQSFGGVLVEEEASGYGEGKIRYRIWDNLSGLKDSEKSIVLQILTAPQKDMYLISVPSQILIGSMNRYQEYLNKDGQERERIRHTAEIYAEKMGIFYGVSSRWMNNSAHRLNSFVNIQYDTRLGFPESPAAAAGIQEKGKTRDPIMKWVYEANNMLNALNGSAAVANGSIVIWMHTPALGTSDYIFFTFSHETAHNQDGRYFYGGEGRRNGTGAEAHADGNIAQEMRDGAMVFNISKNNDIGTEMTNNFSYERIDTAEKIHSYYREMFDTGYVLDYLAAQAFFELTPEQQAAVAVQAEHTAGGNSSMSTTYRKLTAGEVHAMNLDSMEALWDHKISIRNAASYPEKISTATEGSYGFESFYTMNWYQSHNDNGSPDTHSFKRLGQEMLGLAGYEKGYKVYMSALSDNDLEALRKITGNPDITWKKYKLDRYQEVEEKLHQIPYFDKERVIEQFKEAFKADAANGNTNRSMETKRMIYGMVKRVTGDFSDGGIYKSPTVIPITSAEEFVHQVSKNPYGYYSLEQDIDFSGISASGGSYISGRFIGILDGNGYQMTGMKYPLFGDMQYAKVKDLIISASSYEGDAQAILAVKAKKATVGNIKAVNVDLSLPLIKTKTEGYYEYGDISVTVGVKRITTPEEFLDIGASAQSLKKQYVLETDLDFRTSSYAEFAVRGTFSGKLDGNGHTISGLDAVLFEKMEGAKVSNLTVQGSHLTKNTQQGALSNDIRDSTVEDIKIKEVTIANDTNQVGGLAGVIADGEIRRVSVEDISIRSNNTIGGIAGQFDGRILEDSMVTGVIEGTIRHQMGTRIGGITGWQGGGIIRRCLTKINITAPEPTGNGGIIGGPSNGNVSIESSVSLSTGVNANRISGWDVLGITSSVYELDSSDSTSNLHGGNADRVFSVSEEETAKKYFYTETLGWSEDVWDFREVTGGGLPKLR